MKVLHVLPSLSPKTGGPAQAVLEMAEAQARSGMGVAIFCTDLGMERAPAADGVEVRVFKRSWPKRYFYSSGLQEELRRRVKEFQVVHIHGLWLYPTHAAAEACRRTGVPYILRPCGMLDRYSVSHHGWRKAVYAAVREKKNLEHAASIHFTTEEERTRSTLFGLSRPSAVIPLGLDLSKISQGVKGAFRQKHPELKDKKIILYLGRINFKKGLDILVEAFCGISREHPKAHCVIAGPDDGDYGRRVASWVKRAGLDSRVTRLGFVHGKEKAEILADADMFCLPSHEENFGLTVLEAMAAGVPVVVSDQVNLHPDIVAADAGLVTRCDAVEVAEALNRLLSNDGLRGTLGANAANLARKNYSWPPIIERMQSFYESVAHPHQR